MKLSCCILMAMMVNGVHSDFTSPLFQRKDKKKPKREMKVQKRKINRKPGILPTIIAETANQNIDLPPTCISNDSDVQPIPKLIIQTVKTRDELNDLKWFTYHSSLVEQNPDDYAFLVFDDNEALQFIDEHFQGTDLPDIVRNVPRPVMKADLFRLAAVSVLGGFYMDMDMQAKRSFDPIVDSGCGAVFPKEWWKGNDAFMDRHFTLPTDEEEHWQVGNYAFAAVPNHPLLTDSLEEAMKRTKELIDNNKETNNAEVTDLDVLRTTGPYMLSEVYHAGRKAGKYSDVLHIQGDKSKPSKKNQDNRHEWHKFGPYAEHMLSHTWVQAEEELKSVSK